MPTETLTPSLTLITGRPGAGKTTLARALAAAVRFDEVVAFARGT